eukprot:1184401-Prorocentrum_minimum.AAC.2
MTSQCDIIITPQRDMTSQCDVIITRGSATARPPGECYILITPQRDMTSQCDIIITPPSGAKAHVSGMNGDASPQWSSRTLRTEGQSSASGPRCKRCCTSWFQHLECKCTKGYGGGLEGVWRGSEGGLKGVYSGSREGLERV